MGVEMDAGRLWKKGLYRAWGAVVIQKVGAPRVLRRKRLIRKRRGGWNAKSRCSEEVDSKA